MESRRWETLHRAAVTVQSAWRGHQARKRWPVLRRALQQAHHAPPPPPAPCAAQSANKGKS